MMLRVIILIGLILLPCVIAEEVSEEQKKMFHDKGKITSENKAYAQKKIRKKYDVKGLKVKGGDKLVGDNYHATRGGNKYIIPMDEFEGSKIRFADNAVIIDGRRFHGNVKGLHKSGNRVTVEYAEEISFKGNTFRGVEQASIGSNGFEIGHADTVMTSDSFIVDGNGIKKMGNAIAVDEASEANIGMSGIQGWGAGEDVTVSDYTEGELSEEVRDNMVNTIEEEMATSENTPELEEAKEALEEGKSINDLTQNQFKALDDALKMDRTSMENLAETANEESAGEKAQGSFPNSKGTYVKDDKGNLASATAMSNKDNNEMRVDDANINNLGKNDVVQVTRQDNGKLEVTTESGSANIEDNGKSVSVAHLSGGDSFRANENDPHYPYGVHASADSPGADVYLRREGEEKNYPESCSDCVTMDLAEDNIRFATQGEFEVKENKENSPNIFQDVLRADEGETNIELEGNSGKIYPGENFQGQVWSARYETKYSESMPKGRGFRFHPEKSDFVNGIGEDITIDENLVYRASNNEFTMSTNLTSRWQV